MSKKPKKKSAAKTRSKKKTGKSTKKAKRGKKSGKKVASSEDSGVPSWGPELTVGTILGAGIVIKEPLNQEALGQTSPVGALTLVFHERVSKLEKQVEGLVRDLDLHHRLARLEAQVEEE